MEEGCSDILEYLTSPPSYAHQVIIGRNSMEMTPGYWQEFSNIESHELLVLISNCCAVNAPDDNFLLSNQDTNQFLV